MDRRNKENILKLATAAPKKTWGGQWFPQGSFFVATYITGGQEVLRKAPRFLAADRWRNRNTTMERKILQIFGLVFTIFMTSCSKTEHRYDLVQSSESGFTITMLIDKKSGTVWFLDMKDAKWINLGTPPEAAPNKGNQLKLPDKNLD